MASQLTKSATRLAKPVKKKPKSEPKQKPRRSGGIARSSVTKKIFELFVAPLLNEFLIPEDLSENMLTTKLDMLFCKGTRHIWLVRALRSFKLVGPTWLTSDTPERLHVNGAGRRDVKKGEYLWVRFDSTKPFVTEVEYDNQVFCVATRDWTTLSEHCEEVL